MRLTSFSRTPTQFMRPTFSFSVIPVQAGSPALSAGTNLGPSVVGAVDIAGNPRVVNGTISIGAYEQ